MDTATIIVSTVFALIILFKIYNLRKKGIKETLKQKLVVLPVVAVVVGIFMILNPEYELQSPKSMLTEFVSSFIEEKDIK